LYAPGTRNRGNVHGYHLSVGEGLRGPAGADHAGDSQIAADDAGVTGAAAKAKNANMLTTDIAAFPPLRS